MKFRTLVTDASRLGFAARDALRGGVMLMTVDAVEHDPSNGQFTAGHGAQPSSASEHKQQSEWHTKQAKELSSRGHGQGASATEHRKSAQSHGEIAGTRKRKPPRRFKTAYGWAGGGR